MDPKNNSCKLNGGRFMRIWHLVEEISASPGSTRAQLARKYHLSERQVQADLNIIRDLIGLPLVRAGGYRFTDGGAMPLRQALLMVSVLRQASMSRSQPREIVAELLAGIPEMCAVHVRPVVAQMAAEPYGPKPSAFLTLAEAILSRSALTIMTDRLEPFAPELLVPLLGRWFVIGEGPDWLGRPSKRMVAVDRILEIRPAGKAAA